MPKVVGVTSDCWVLRDGSPIPGQRGTHRETLAMRAVVTWAVVIVIAAVLLIPPVGVAAAPSATLVADIHPWSGSGPESLTVVGKTVFFSATDGTNGRELWATDGTPVGTRLVRDIRPGSGGSAPRSLTRVGIGCTSVPTMAATAANCGSATARARAPAWCGTWRRAARAPAISRSPRSAAGPTSVAATRTCGARTERASPRSWCVPSRTSTWSGRPSCDHACISTLVAHSG